MALGDRHDPTGRDPLEGVRRERPSWRLWAMGIAILLLAIIVAQNSQEVDFDFLFVETETPLIVGLLIAGALGALIGWLAPIVRRGRRGD
jgi:uncharacterized integral membrane protein